MEKHLLITQNMSIRLEQNNRKSNEPLTRVWQKWRFSAPQTHLWLIKHWFSASTFVVKIPAFAKPETVSGNHRKTERKNEK
jgi:pyrroloquinoline quinone (PQQ) biosynthesis protein C